MMREEGESKLESQKEEYEALYREHDEEVSVYDNQYYICGDIIGSSS